MVNCAALHIGRLDIDPLPFTAGKPEVALTWEEGGVHCRALLDWLHDDFSAIDDYKTTTRTANPDLYRVDPIQAAWYTRGLMKVHQTPRYPEFRYVVQETYPPYALSVISPTPAALALA